MYTKHKIISESRIKTDYPRFSHRKEILRKIQDHLNSFEKKHVVFSLSYAEQVETAKEERYRLDPQQRWLQVRQPELTMLCTVWLHSPVTPDPGDLRVYDFS